MISDADGMLGHKNGDMWIPLLNVNVGQGVLDSCQKIQGKKLD